MLEDIVKDVRSLDAAKTNLTHTITALRRLHMLDTAIGQLDAMTSRRQYRDAAALIDAVEQLVRHFEAFRDVPRVVALRTSYANISATLRLALIEDFSKCVLEPYAHRHPSGCRLMHPPHSCAPSPMGASSPTPLAPTCGGSSSPRSPNGR